MYTVIIYIGKQRVLHPTFSKIKVAAQYLRDAIERAGRKGHPLIGQAMTGEVVAGDGSLELRGE
jgi:hypothetical protein